MTPPPARPLLPPLSFAPLSLHTRVCCVASFVPHRPPPPACSLSLGPRKLAPPPAPPPSWAPFRICIWPESWSLLGRHAAGSRPGSLAPYMPVRPGRAKWNHLFFPLTPSNLRGGIFFLRCLPAYAVNGPPLNLQPCLWCQCQSVYLVGVYLVLVLSQISVL
jgi:hypothetical protein